MVLRLMDTEEYANDYCNALNLVLELFPEVDRRKLEKELNKYYGSCGSGQKRETI